MKAPVLVLVFCCMWPLVSSAKPYINVQQFKPAFTIPLSMMDQSVDDMYKGCQEKMAAAVNQKYFQKESYNTLFGMAWKSAEGCLKKALLKKKDKALTNNHLRAICVYTAESPNVYKPFNTAVRTLAANYGTPLFPYHSLHFWLTSAIQILGKPLIPFIRTCQTTYRRTKDTYTGEPNQIIRFGNFASTSFRTDLFQFGTETCFHIRTCHGAYLKDYSYFDKNEAEVLIPPYEKFKITAIKNGYYKNLKNCKKIFVLESKGVQSTLNCKAVR